MYDGYGVFLDEGSALKKIRGIKDEGLLVKKYTLQLLYELVVKDYEKFEIVKRLYSLYIQKLNEDDCTFEEVVKIRSHSFSE